MQRFRHVALVIDPACIRRIHLELAREISRNADKVTVLRGRSRHPLPASVDLLFELERILHRIVGLRLADRADFAPALSAEAIPCGELPDLVIDFCGSETVPGERTVRVLYDGAQGECALMDALVNGRMPVIDIEDAKTGERLASGVPCADNAGTLLESYECALARLIPLLMSGLREHMPNTGSARRAEAPNLRLRSLAAFEAKAIAHSIVRRLYALCFYTPHWRTCWRFVDGPDVWQTRTLSNANWNVIPDPGFRFYADPFPFSHKGQTYLFVEDLDHGQNKGVISVIPFNQIGPSGPAQPVLEEPWHLSYPFLIEHDGQVWMIPESSANGTISLYRASHFPNRWVQEAVLISGIEASDATVIFHDGHFWMFAATRDGRGSWSDTLSIFFARSLLGPWEPHPCNPILIDQATARPAGAMFARDGRLWRPVQDCSGGYGTGIGLGEIVRLDREGFDQKIHAVLRPHPNWPGRRLHTLNRAGGIECIDGAAYSPRSRRLGRYLQNWSGRRDLPADSSLGFFQRPA